jgi:hypothetical protein
MDTVTLVYCSKCKKYRSLNVGEVAAYGVGTVFGLLTGSGEKKTECRLSGCDGIVSFIGQKSVSEVAGDVYDSTGNKYPK